MWFKGMADAAGHHNLSIQYCLRSLTDMLIALGLPQVTQGRASGDYGFPTGPAAAGEGRLSIYMLATTLLSCCPHHIPHTFTHVCFRKRGHLGLFILAFWGHRIRPQQRHTMDKCHTTRIRHISRRSLHPSATCGPRRRVGRLVARPQWGSEMHAIGQMPA